MTGAVRIVVFASGNGSNFQALIDAIGTGSIEHSEIAALICDTPGAGCLDRAVRHGIPSWCIPLPEGARRGSPARLAWNQRLAGIAEFFEPDWILLLGWMRLLDAPFLECFPGRVVNLHPALPGTFPGTHAIEDAYRAFREGRIERTGIMLHLVPDEKVDCGPVLRFAEVEIRDTDTLETLAQRIHEVEHREVVALVRQLVQRQLVEKEHNDAARLGFSV